jgi:deoxycytidine triphosphate deaminase
LFTKSKNSILFSAFNDTGGGLYPQAPSYGGVVVYTANSTVDGLMIDASLSGDVGFSGYWTLEMFCVQPIRIYAGVEICQIYFHTVLGEAEKYISGKYQNNQGIQPSLLYKDFEK